MERKKIFFIFELKKIDNSALGLFCLREKKDTTKIDVASITMGGILKRK